MSPERQESPTSKKRKVPNSTASASPSFPIEPATKEEVPRKIRRVGWGELEPLDQSEGVEFDFDNIDTLWYQNLDYATFLRQQLIALADDEWCKAYLHEHGPM